VSTQHDDAGLHDGEVIEVSEADDVTAEHEAESPDTESPAAESDDTAAESDDVADDTDADTDADTDGDADGDTVAAIAEETAEEEELDPVEEMRAALCRAPGDWYVVHSYAGYENKVKANLETRVQTLDVEDYIFQVEVPTEEVTEIKNGHRKQVQRKIYPGYILVRMDLTDESWGAVRNTPGVTGFVGATSRPSPLTLDEVVKIIAPATKKAVEVAKGGKAAAGGDKPRVEVVDFSVGESVTVMDGPFATLPATIS